METGRETHAQAIHVHHREALLPAIIIRDILRVILDHAHLQLQPIITVPEVHLIRGPHKGIRLDQRVHQILQGIQIELLLQEQINQVLTIPLRDPQVIVIQLLQEQGLRLDPVIQPLVLQVRLVVRLVPEVLQEVEVHLQEVVIADKILTLQNKSYEKQTYSFSAYRKLKLYINGSE